MNEEDREKLVKFLANQLLKEATFEQALQLLRYQAVQEAKAVFEKMTDAEKQSLLNEINQLGSTNE